MATYKDKGRWRYRVSIKLPSGESVRLSGTAAVSTRAEAQAAERAHIQRTLHPATTPTPTKQSPLFKDFVSKWWDLYQLGGGVRGKNAPTTIKEKTSHLNHIVPALGHHTLEAVSNERLTEFAAKLRARDLSEKTLKNIFTTLGTILRTAVDWGTLAKVPKLPTIKPAEPEWDWLPPQAIERIRQVPLPVDTRAAVSAALFSGMRQGEQLALEWSDVDFVRKEIRLHRNRPSGSRVTTFTKGKKGRTVPLTDELAAALQRLPRDDVRVFPLTPYLLNKMLREALEAAGVEAVSWHSLRHTYASHLVSKGIPLRKVQNLLSHSSIRTTERYAHLSPHDGNKEVLEALR